MADALRGLLSPPPAQARAELSALRAALDVAVPPKVLGRNLLIGTWNVRRLGGVVERWRAREEDRPKRDWLGVAAIAEIVSRFDVVAVQEVCGNLRALEGVMALLGPEWNFLMTDVNAGDGGNGERMAFVFDRRRLHLAGLAAELVVPAEEWAEIGPTAFRSQFARAPYAVSFEAHAGERIRFTLVTLHILYGKKASEGRLDEVRATAGWLARWSRRRHGHGDNLVCLGDFNIDRHGDALWQAFTATGLVVPEALREVPRSIFDDRARALDKYYDQIAWFRRRFSLACTAAGSFDFLPHLYQRPALAASAVSHRVSDHYPLWVELASAP